MKTLIMLPLAVVYCLSLQAQKLPDLVVEEITEPDYEDGSVFKVIVRNKGKAKSTPTTLTVYDLDISLKEAKAMGVQKQDWWIFEENVERSEDGNLDYDEDFEQSFEVPAIGRGGKFTIKVFVEHWVYDSNCEIGATIDPENKVKEKNEKNNKSFFVAGG